MNHITPHSKDFAKWYEDVLTFSNFAYHGLVKGTLFLYPKSCYVWEQIQKFINKEFELLNIENVMFPAFIPGHEIELEKEKLSGFIPELFLVKSHSCATDKSSEQKKCSCEFKDSNFLRPTSEILFSHYFRHILKKQEDLPICLNQWCPVYRSERNTKLLLRSCEFYWQEAHTVHETQEEALSLMNKFHEIYVKLITNLLCIAVLDGEKTICERFLGSDNTLTVESIMPDGQILQMATSHFLGNNFSTSFNVKYSDKNNQQQNPYQLSAGCSTRLLGSLVMSHSDDQGLVLPWDLSKIKINIIVLENVIEKGDAVYKKISESLKDFKCKWDFSDKSFGHKINDSEINGFPIAIIIGTKEIASQTALIKSRVESEKVEVAINDLTAEILKKKENFNKCLFKKNQQNLSNRVVAADKLETVIKIVKEEHKVALVPWFDDKQNETDFKSKSYGFAPRCIKERISDNNIKCFFSGKVANCFAYFGRSY